MARLTAEHCADLLRSFVTSYSIGSVVLIIQDLLASFGKIDLQEGLGGVGANATPSNPQWALSTQ